MGSVWVKCVALFDIFSVEKYCAIQLSFWQEAFSTSTNVAVIRWVLVSFSVPNFTMIDLMQHTRILIKTAGAATFTVAFHRIVATDFGFPPSLILKRPYPKSFITLVGAFRMCLCFGWVCGCVGGVSCIDATHH